MPRSSPAARALIAYSRGVNDYLAGVRASREWPAVFSLAGVYPASWTPVDSLLVQGFVTQELDFTTVPLDYALLERSLGAVRTIAVVPDPAAQSAEPVRPCPLPLPGYCADRDRCTAASGYLAFLARRARCRVRGCLSDRACLVIRIRPGFAPGRPGRVRHPRRRCRTSGRAGLHLSGEQCLGCQRPEGCGRRSDAGRRPACAAVLAVDLVPGHAVGAGSVGFGYQRAWLAGCADRLQLPHRLVGDQHAESGHAVLRRADQQEPSWRVLV